MSARNTQTIPIPPPALRPDAPALRLSAAVDGRTVTCVVRRPITLIGSRRDCDLALPDPDVSKVHCAIVYTGRCVVVCDLRSRTGTQLNGTPVTVAAYAPGAPLRVGPVAVTVEWSPATSPGPADLAAAQELNPPLTLTGPAEPYRLGRLPALVGHRNTCDVVIDDPDVSLVHALLFALDGRPAVCDLGSRSGTSVNNAAVAVAWLSDGDTLRIGRYAFAVSVPAAAPEALAAAVVAEPGVAPPTAAVPEAPVLALSVAEGADFDQLLTAIQGQMSQARQNLTVREVELRQREQACASRMAEFDVQAAALTARADEIEQQALALAVRANEFEKRAADLAARGTEIDKQTAALTGREQELARQAAANEQARVAAEQARAAAEQLRQAAEQAQAALAADRQAFEAQKQAAAQRESALAEREAAAAAAGQAVQQRETAFAASAQAAQEREAALVASAQAAQERESKLAAQAEGLVRQTEELAARERSLAQREAAIVRRESAETAMTQRMDQFRSALRQATQTFAQLATSGTAEDPVADAAARRPADGPAHAAAHGQC